MKPAPQTSTFTLLRGFSAVIFMASWRCSDLGASPVMIVAVQRDAD